MKQLCRLTLSFTESSLLEEEEDVDDELEEEDLKIRLSLEKQGSDLYKW